IMISGFAGDDMMRRAADHGLYTLLYKPFAMDRIFRVVDRALKRRTLLIVDDAAPYLASLSASLTALRETVHAVADRDAAVAFAQQHPVDVCVLDLVMSPADGVETCMALRSVDPEMDIVAITGSADPELVRRITKQGIAACLRKPFQVKDLL